MCSSGVFRRKLFGRKGEDLSLTILCFVTFIFGVKRVWSPCRRYAPQSSSALRNVEAVGMAGVSFNFCLPQQKKAKQRKKKKEKKCLVVLLRGSLRYLVVGFYCQNSVCVKKKKKKKSRRRKVRSKYPGWELRILRTSASGVAAFHCNSPSFPIPDDSTR